MMKKLLVAAIILLLLVPALAACGKAAPTPLPNSGKGYELFSWQAGGKWHFTLITGTNRNKSLIEIISDNNTGDGSDDGWVNIHVTGADAINALLQRIPAGQWVTWSGGKFVEPAGGTDFEFTYPPADTVNEIKAAGLNFNAAGP